MASFRSTHRLLSCTEQHIPSIHAIMEYYLFHAVLTFALYPPSEEVVLKNYRDVREQGFPFIVAVLDDSCTRSFFTVAGSRAGDDGEDAIGSVYVTDFKKERAGYRYTVELSLFCHPEHRRGGVVPLILEKLIEVLEAPDAFPEYAARQKTKDDRERSVIACVALDETGWKQGLGLRDFYVKHEFEELGHLRKVGCKFDMPKSKSCNNARRV